MHGGDGEKADATTLIYVYIGVASVGTLSFGFLMTEEVPTSEEGEEEVRLSLSEKLLRSFLLIKEPKFALMIAVIFYSGIEQAFIFSIFTGKIITPSVGQENIGFIMATFGAIDTVASLIMGKIADNWGPHIVALTGGFCQLSVMVAYFIGLKFVSVKWFHDYSYLLYLTAGVWAIGDAAFNLFPNYVMSVLFTDNAEAAFATLKFFQALGSVLPFLLGPLLFLELIIACFIGVLIIAFVCLAFLHFFVQPINGASPQEPQAEAINTTNKISD